MALNVELIVSTVDRATAGVRRINARIDSMLAPIGRVRSSLRSLDTASGFRALRGSIGSVGSQFARLGFAATGLAGGALLLLKNTVIDTGAQFERYQAILTSIEGSSDKAKASMAWVSQFATETPLQLDEVMQAFVSLRTFGLDPMDGTLQSLVDQNSKLGGSAADLQGIILQLGQAFTKNKLQMEDVIPLQQKGVPVVRLLADAMGKSTEAINEMISKGELGRDAVRLLIDEIGKSSVGASAEQMKTFGGLVSNMADQWTRFQKMVADAGIFDVIKSKLEGALGAINRLAQSGKLQEWAQKVSDAAVKVVEAIPGIVEKIANIAKTASDFVGGPGNLLKATLIGLAAIIVGPLLSAIATFSAVLLLTPVGWFITAVAAIVGGFVLLNQWFKNGAPAWLTSWSGLWNGVQSVLSAVWNWIVDFGVRLWDIVKTAWLGYMNWVLGPLLSALGLSSLQQAWASVVAFAQSMWNGVQAAWSTFADWVGGFWAKISGPFNAIRGFIGGGSKTVSLTQKAAPSASAASNVVKLPSLSGFNPAAPVVGGQAIGSNAPAPFAGFRPQASNQTTVNQKNEVAITVNQQPGENGSALATRIDEQIRQNQEQRLRGALHDGPDMAA